MSLAADGHWQAENGLQLEEITIQFQVVSAGLPKMAINSHGLYSLCELRICLPLDVHELSCLPLILR